MPLPLFRKKGEKERIDRVKLPLVAKWPLYESGQDTSRASISGPRNVEHDATPEEPVIEYNVEPEMSASPAPDIRLLSSLGGCAVQVSTVETIDTLPNLEYARRGSNLSAKSASSAPLVTPTFPGDSSWECSERNQGAPVNPVGIHDQTEGEVASTPVESHAHTFSHCWSSSATEELDLSQLLSLTGGTNSSSASPFGFETLGSKPPSSSRRPRPTFEDEDDFYVPGLSSAVGIRPPYQSY